jgi:hypothetical protein
VFEYKMVQLPSETNSWNLRDLSDLGVQGWELIDLGTPQGHYGTVTQTMRLRRSSEGDAYGQDWDYHSFDVFGMPSEWWPHIASCGWTIIDPPYFRYYSMELHFAKRPGSLRGTDDGDIQARLNALGIYKHPISEILEAKWIQSELAGPNIGTEAAVRYWLAHSYVPHLLNVLGIEPLSVSPLSLLDELLSLRCALGADGFPPPLSDAVKTWAQLRK